MISFNKDILGAIFPHLSPEEIRLFSNTNKYIRSINFHHYLEPIALGNRYFTDIDPDTMKNDLATLNNDGYSLIEYLNDLREVVDEDILGEKPYSFFSQNFSFAHFVLIINYHY